MSDIFKMADEWKRNKDEFREREARQTRPERIAAIKARLAASSEGPWSACGEERGGCQCCLIYGKEAIVAEATYNLGDEEHQPGRKEDAAFIAHAKQDIPWLLDLVAEAGSTEGAATTQWLRAENQRLRAVHEAVKAWLDDGPSFSKQGEALRAAVHAVDVAAWRDARPDLLQHMPAWAAKRPAEPKKEPGTEIRTWTEDDCACVSDGTGLLVVRGVQIDAHLRPQSAFPMARVTSDVDWSKSPHTTTYQALAEALDVGETTGVLVQVGTAKFQAQLIERLLPRLAADEVLDVFVSADERAVMALRPHGSDAWSLLIMPRIDENPGHMLALQSPA